jgi:hypothetical protein
MADQIRIDEMNISAEEKKLLIRALTDKKFRDKLQRQVDGGAVELSDEEMSAVAGGVGGTGQFSSAQMRNILGNVRNLEGRLMAGAELLCGGGPCGIA